MCVTATTSSPLLVVKSTSSLLLPTCIACKYLRACTRLKEALEKYGEL